jgi:DNA (cytosine-5)-methyltransferase 1
MPIRVVELFAGVGGFRIGLEGWNGKSALSGYRRKIDSDYQVVWSNQWEPSTNIQHASMIYEARFGDENHSNKNIEKVKTKDIPNHDLLVGGFPCQDYSVATSLINSNGLRGKKGVLWWSIERILRKKRPRPRYLLLENVDRLIKSPAKQKGRDFAVMLESLDKLGYAVEWKVINAGEYGMPQSRKRIFIVGYHKSTNIYKDLKKAEKLDWIGYSGILAQSFPSNLDIARGYNCFELSKDLVNLTNNFNKGKNESPFKDAGIMMNGKVTSTQISAHYKKASITLGDIVSRTNGEVTEDYFIDEKDLVKWKEMKGAKKIPRVSKSGYEYLFSEGAIEFPDSLNRPSRTIITGEGGKSPSRIKHVVKVNQRYRRLIPKELDALNMFPPDFTLHDEVSDSKRAFLMGNALVVGVVEKIGKELSNRI